MDDRFSVAVLADIHGNYHALQAVSEDLSSLCPDCCVFAGDIVSGGARPGECLREMDRLRASGVLGNMDEKVVSPVCRMTRWTNRQLSETDVGSLASLPLCQRVTPPGGKTPMDDLLVVHATPRSCRDLLILAPRRINQSRFGRKTPEDVVSQMLIDEVFSLMMYGHIHYFSESTVCGRRLMSIGSLGFPFDEDLRAGYALACWNGSSWDVEVRRVEYDNEEAARFIEQSGQPYSRRYAEMIRRARFLPKSEEFGYEN